MEDHTVALPRVEIEEGGQTHCSPCYSFVLLCAIVILIYVFPFDPHSKYLACCVLVFREIIVSSSPECKVVCVPTLRRQIVPHSS
jgi:hypothetical protein